jgi:hypothetical protein
MKWFSFNPNEIEGAACERGTPFERVSECRVRLHPRDSGDLHP